MKKTMLTYETLERFEKIVNPDTLTAEQVKEIEDLAYCANMGAESRENAWNRFAYLVKGFMQINLAAPESSAKETTVTA